MTREEEKNVTKNRILAACVKLFIEQGYYKTTLSQIVKEAGVSFSSFQNIFRTKDGVLLDLTKFMFSRQFESARSVGSKDVNPVYVYAVETAIQLTITELNENLREIYVEAYTNPESSEYIYRSTSVELTKIFSRYNPKSAPGDFYELEIGSSGIMRNYMAKKCDQYFTLNKKIERFITMSFRAYHVPEDEIEGAIEFVRSIDIKAVSNEIMGKLFKTLAMRFDFSLS